MYLQKARRSGLKFMNPIETTVGGANVWKVLPEMLFSRKARVPSAPLGPFRTDASVYATPPASGLRMTWMGHSTTLVEIDGVRLLLDPVWDDYAAPTQWAGPKRFFAPPLALDALPSIDAVIFSHDHYDHLGAGTVRRLAALAATGITKDAQWIVPLGVRDVLRKLGAVPARCVELDWTDSVQVGDVRVTALPSRHFAGRSLFNRNETLWASYVFAGPQHRVYYGADSGEWPGYAEIGEQFGPGGEFGTFDVAMFEIGAWNEMWSGIHMGPEGAVRSFRALTSNATGDTLLMPIHWGLFDLALHHWRQPIESIWKAEGIKLWSPEPGRPEEVVKGVELRSEWWKRSS